MNLKICTKCNIKKPKTNDYFYNSKEFKDGLSYWCKECYKKYNKKYERTDLSKEKKRKYGSKFYKNNKEEVLIKNKKYWQTPKGKFAEYKSRAKKSSLDFELTFEQFYSFWQNKCFYCGDTIEKIGIDRIDNLKGYNLDNCIPCCFICNNMKHTASLKDFINHIKKIINNQGDNIYDSK